MITNTPNIVDVNAAFNLLSILELVKDAATLKKSLAPLKEAQDALIAATVANKASESAALAAAEKSEKAADKAASQKQDAANTIAGASAAVAALDDARLSAKTERTAFDDWMAVQREQLAAKFAEAESKADLNARAEATLIKDRADLDKKNAKLDAAIAAADAKREEFDAKLLSLRSLVS